MAKVPSGFPANPSAKPLVAKAVGYAHAKGARAAARKVMGGEAVEGDEFEVFPVGERFDWKAIEKERASGRKSDKGSGLQPPLSEGQLVDPNLLVSPADPALAALPPETAEVVAGVVNVAANAFGAAAIAALSNPQPRAPRADDAGGRRETDKPVVPRKEKVQNEIVNGVRKPSPGTTCRAVWDELEKLQAETGTPPDSKAVKTLANSKKWNANNASIEFYQWRKFHGIKGRAKAAPAPSASKKPAAKPIV